MLRQLFILAFLLVLVGQQAYAQPPFVLNDWADQEFKQSNYNHAVKFATFSLKSWSEGKKAKGFIVDAFLKGTSQSDSLLKLLKVDTETFRGDTTVFGLERIVRICGEDMELTAFVKRELGEDSEPWQAITEILSEVGVPDCPTLSKEALSKLEGARQKAAAMHYRRAEMLMSQTDQADSEAYNSLDSSRLAAKELTRTLYFDPQFKDAKTLEAAAREAGTKHFAVMPFNYLDQNFRTLCRLIGNQTSLMATQDKIEFVAVKPFNQVESRALTVDYNATVSVDEPQSIAPLAQELEVDEILFGEIVRISPGEPTTTRPVEQEETYTMPDTIYTRLENGSYKKTTNRVEGTITYYRSETSVTSTIVVRYRRYNARTGEASPIMTESLDRTFTQVNISNIRNSKSPKFNGKRPNTKEYRKIYDREVEGIKELATTPLPEAEQRYESIVREFTRARANALAKRERTDHLQVIKLEEQLNR